VPMERLPRSFGLVSVIPRVLSRAGLFGMLPRGWKVGKRNLYSFSFCRKNGAVGDVRGLAMNGGNGMSDTLVDKLLESFDQLEHCISVTREVLAQKQGVPSDVIDRVNQYSEIVAKQRGLAQNLRDHLCAQNWEEVGRHVRLINGLSTMIRDDAQAILLGASQQKVSQKGDLVV
jgi:hypothetical protein